MQQNNTVIFSDFARRAKEKIEEKKKRNVKKIHIGDCGLDITIRGLTEQEINDVYEFSDKSLENDKYMIYMASKELQEEAGALVESGIIAKHYQITEMFSYLDRSRIAEEILMLSGIRGDSTVEVIDEVEEAKN